MKNDMQKVKLVQQNINLQLTHSSDHMHQAL